jgi:multimeric flavodoxin WrbA
LKVVAFNGSPRKEGNTAALIKHVLTELEKEGIETETVQVGGKSIHGCTACAKCFENKDKKCVIDKDIVNECIEKMIEADGIILGSPTYFADMTPELKALRACLKIKLGSNIGIGLMHLNLKRVALTP